MSKAILFSTLICTCLLLTVAFNNCSAVKFDPSSALNIASTNSNFGICQIDIPCIIPCIGNDCDSDGNHIGDGNGNHGSEGATSQIYEAQVPSLTNKVDIIFVIDNSSSMKSELQSLGTKFMSLTSALGERDWQACLITTDYENEKGKPRTWSNGDYILSSATHNKQGVFENTLSSIVPENDPGNFEQGIRSVSALIEKGFDSFSEGCLRADAGKAIVFVSDEDELGDGWILGDKSALQPTPNNYPQSLLDNYSTTFGLALPLSVHAIVILPGDEACLIEQRSEGGSYEETMGYQSIRYTELALKTGGEVVSICSGDYSKPLEQIGQSISNSLDSVELACSANLYIEIVEVTGKVSGTRSFSVAGNKVFLNPVLTAGEKLKITFKCF